jgi:hypothetical protein
MSYRLPELVASLLRYGQKNDPRTHIYSIDGWIQSTYFGEGSLLNYPNKLAANNTASALFHNATGFQAIISPRQNSQQFSSASPSFSSTHLFPLHSPPITTANFPLQIQQHFPEFRHTSQAIGKQHFLPDIIHSSSLGTNRQSISSI